MFLGSGFLASHILPHMIPFSKRIILVDRERVEPVNYENTILPKGFTHRRKVSALAFLLQILSSAEVVPVHMNVKNTDQLVELHKAYEPDLCFVTFDNIEARRIARDYALKAGVPAIFVGVTAGHIYVDWAEHVALPEDEETIARVEEEMRAIRDVCSRIEFRELGVLAAGLAYHVFARWYWKGEKIAILTDIGNRIHLSIISVNKKTFTAGAPAMY